MRDVMDNSPNATIPSRLKGWKPHTCNFSTTRAENLHEMNGKTGHDLLKWKNKDGPVTTIGALPGPDHNDTNGACVMAATQPTLSARTCLACEEEIPATRRRHAKYCSNKCRLAADLLARKGLKVTPANITKVHSKKCPCGRKISFGNTYCSEKCKNLSRPFSPSQKIRLAIADRDQWICHICDDSIPRDIDHNDDLALEIDHIVPVRPPRNLPAGTNHPVNLAAAHSLCNARKGNRVTPEALDTLRKNIDHYGANNTPSMYTKINSHTEPQRKTA